MPRVACLRPVRGECGGWNGAGDVSDKRERETHTFATTSEWCPACRERDVLAVVGFDKTDTWLECESCGWVE